jgi:hypothetical protein
VREVVISDRPSAASLIVNALAARSYAWGEYGSGFTWRRSCGTNLAKRRAHRKVRNRIASQSRRKNRA